MQEALATQHTGADLVALRDSYGVMQIAVATELGVSRITLNRWESAPECKPLRWLRYDGACRRILAAAVEGTDAA